MQNDQSKNSGWRDFTPAQLIDLFRPEKNHDGLMQILFIIIGVVLCPVTLLGALLVYKKGFYRLLATNGEGPRLSNLPTVLRVGMAIGGVLIWFALYFGGKVLIHLVFWMGGDRFRYQPTYAIGYLILSLSLTMGVFMWFELWRHKMKRILSESKRHGSARFANDIELAGYRKPEGFYIGNGLYYNKAGMLLTVAGTRGGKLTEVIGYNALMPGLFKGNMIFLDIKGEIASISERVQREANRQVVLLNPWNEHDLGTTTFNPLDFIDANSANLVDDIALLSESIVVPNPKASESHFDDKARSFIGILLLHLVTAIPKELQHLGTLYFWLRLSTEDWAALVADMLLNDHPTVGDIVRAGANEIVSLMKNSDREYGSVMSSAQKATSIFQSPALRESLKSSPDFSTADLASGNVTLYIICPADKLLSYKAWMRLVVTSLMLSVVRNPKAETCFLLDEAYSLQYLSIIDLAYGAFAGYGIHVWSIFQNLGQIKQLYGENWEGFIANSSVRHAFNVHDNFGAEYYSRMFGQKSVLEYNDKGEPRGSSARPLVALDEIRRSENDIYVVIDQLPPAKVPKHPYYLNNLDCDPNPFYKPKPTEDAEDTSQARRYPWLPVTTSLRRARLMKDILK